MTSQKESQMKYTLDEYIELALGGVSSEVCEEAVVDLVSEIRRLQALLP